MATPAGSLRDRITISRAVITTDTYGGEVQDWQPLAQRWASVRYGTGQERREAAQINATVPATFRIRVDSITKTIGPKDRIEFNDGIWNIVGAPVMTPERDMLDIAAVRGV